MFGVRSLRLVDLKTDESHVSLSDTASSCMMFPQPSALYSQEQVERKGMKTGRKSEPTQRNERNSGCSKARALTVCFR